MTEAPVAIGDIHGRLDLLRLAVARFPGRHLVFLGDLCDRGPDSRDVIALVRQLVEAGRATLICGNHDELLQTAVLDGSAYAHWMRNGGQATVDNYDDGWAGLRADAEWLRRTALPALTLDGVLYAHAMRPDPSGQDEDIHLWGRPGESYMHPLPAGVSHSVHGHTPMERPVRLPAPDGTLAWFIDTGAFHTGTLCALDTADWTPHLIQIEVQDGPT